MRSSLLALSLPLIAACTVHGYFTLPTTVQVSPDGDDANDGFNLPVRTLKRGIGIATETATITAILVAAGRYDATSGETFPYTVPANLTISGPLGGGAILAGTGAEPGLVIGAGELRDLELERFAVAVTANGIAQLTNLHVRSSGTAIRGEAASRLTVSKLDITGPAGLCAATGVELNADAELTVSEVSTRALGVAFQIKDRTTVSISKANITGYARCQDASFAVATTETFALDNSIVEGGRYGIYFFGAATPTTATLAGTTLRNMDNGLTGGSVNLTMSGGEINTYGYGVDAYGGWWILNNVTIDGVYIRGGGDTSPGRLDMRGCTITGAAVYLSDYAQADLGRIEDPGNNTFTDPYYVGLNIAGRWGARLITAVGNTWLPNVQGSDAVGRYPVVATVSGPVEPNPNSNFAIAAGWSLQR